VTGRRKLAWFIALPFLLLLSIAVAFWYHPVGFFRSYTELKMRVEGARSLSTTASGYRIHYYVLGPSNGSPVVLVHGLAGRSEDWRNLAPYLAKAGYRVYLPDLPGYGQSEQPRNFSYSIHDQAAVLVSFMDAMGLKQVDLGGWSMGGWIVQHVAADHPDRIRRLMLFDSAGVYKKPLWDPRLFTPANTDEIDQLDALLMPNSRKLPQFLANDILRISREHAWIIHRAVNSMLSGRDATDALLPTLKMPVLLVWGSEDQITPLSLGETMHSLIPDSRLNLVSGCGHLAPDQCASQIGPGLVEFLQK
jgi:pimeloyl-ACP methyl ester carboxylesterase